MITTIKMKSFSYLGVAGLLFFSLQSFAGAGHDHGADSHDNNDSQGHEGHGEEAALVYTHYSENAELFVEFPPLVVN